MNITKSDVEKLAHLSKLELGDESIAKMQGDMNKMLSFVDKINELDLEDVRPMTYMNEELNVLREDDVKHDVSHEEALKNAPDKNSDYFKVPKVLKK